jgi:tungstate transport system substrate-binding protein
VVHALDQLADHARAVRRDDEALHTATLNTAPALDAYVLSDRATWLALKKNLGDLGIEVEGDKRLFNRYGVILVNPAKYPSAKKDLGQQFIDG